MKTGLDLEKNLITYYHSEKKEIVTESVFGVDPYICDNCREYIAPNRPADNLCPFCKQEKLRWTDFWR